MGWGPPGEIVLLIWLFMIAIPLVHFFGGVMYLQKYCVPATQHPKRKTIWIPVAAVLLVVSAVADRVATQQNKAHFRRMESLQDQQKESRNQLFATVGQLVQPEFSRLAASIDRNESPNYANEIGVVNRLVHESLAEANKSEKSWDRDVHDLVCWWILREYLYSCNGSSKAVQMGCLELVKQYIDENDANKLIRFQMWNGTSHHLVAVGRDHRYAVEVRQAAFNMLLDYEVLRSGRLNIILNSDSDQFAAKPMAEYLLNREHWNNPSTSSELWFCAENLRKFPEDTKPFLSELTKLFYELARGKVQHEGAFNQLIESIVAIGGSEAIDAKQLVPDNSASIDSDDYVKHWARTVERLKSDFRKKQTKR